MDIIWTCQSGTSFTNCSSEQNRKMNIFELFMNQARKVLYIFDEDMTQRIYEIFLGILGMTEMQAASQPRAKVDTWT